MKKKNLILIAVFSLAVVGIVGFRMSNSASKIQWKKLDPSEGEFSVKVTANGSVTPRNKIVVTTPIAGRVDTVLVEEGAKVKKGQQLALLSSSDRVALMDSMHEGIDPVERERLQEMYRPTPIYAPATGTVVLRAVNQGQTVNQEGTLFEISDKLIVVSKVDETDIAKVHVGQDVDVSIDAYSTQSYKGVVERIGQQSTVTNNVTTYDVFIAPKESFPEIIKSGMSSNVDYLVSKKDKALVIPTWLSEGRKNTKVQLYVQSPEGLPQVREVSLGESNGDSVEVLAGLTMNDHLMYKPLTYEKDPKGVPFNVVGSKKK